MKRYWTAGAILLLLGSSNMRAEQEITTEEQKVDLFNRLQRMQSLGIINAKTMARAQEEIVLHKHSPHKSQFQGNTIRKVTRSIASQPEEE